MKYLAIIFLGVCIAACEKDAMVPVGSGNAYMISETTFGKITTASATLTYTVSGSSSGPKIIERGLCIDTILLPKVTGNRVTGAASLGTYIVSVKGLRAGTRYFVRGYYKLQQAAVVYGSGTSFTTNRVEPANVSIKTIRSVLKSGATIDCVINSTGGGVIESKGICWGINPNPITSGPYVSSGQGAANYSSSITGLLSNTIYYVRAFTINETGITYSTASTSFKTSN